MTGGADGDWQAYWRSPDEPLEAMHARFRQHVYHRHSHDSYSFGVTEWGHSRFTAGTPRTPAPPGWSWPSTRTTRTMGTRPPPAVRGERLLAAIAAASRFAVTPVPAGAPGTQSDLLRTARRVRDHLESSVASQVSWADLADAAGCSRYAAYRAFRAVHGLAPSEYQRQLRLRAARRSLAAGLTPAEAAASAGFADQAHLTRWFRRCYGVTPAAFQRAVS